MARPPKKQKSEEVITPVPAVEVVDEAITELIVDTEPEAEVAEIEETVVVCEPVQPPTTDVKLTARAAKYLQDFLSPYFGYELKGVDLPAVEAAICAGKQVYLTKAPMCVNIDEFGVAFSAQKPETDTCSNALPNLNRALANARFLPQV